MSGTGRKLRPGSSWSSRARLIAFSWLVGGASSMSIQQALGLGPSRPWCACCRIRGSVRSSATSASTASGPGIGRARGARCGSPPGG
eukprot:4450580-Alexandrium_andersonii.AAC.1